MFSKMWIKPSTSDCSGQINQLKQALQRADAVVIGAGAGLSTSAGFTYTGSRFSQYFSDFENTYGFHDMYSGGFYSFASLEEYWAYWSRYIFINRYQPAPQSTYQNLLHLVQDKDYFVLTTNVDHQFQQAGFDKNVYSTRRAIMDCFNAVYRVIRKPMTINASSFKWFMSKRTCACRVSLCHIVQSAASL